MSVELGEKKCAENEKSNARYNLFRFGPLKRAFKARSFQFILQLPMVFFLVLVITAGLYGIPDPGKNLATVAVWTVWWTGVILLILTMGATWCLICPWAAVADWLERLSLWKKKTGLTMGVRWPAALRNRHLATAFFIVVTWLELGISVTYSPSKTAYLAFAMVFLATLTVLIFEKKAFCRYICFVGGIVGMYSNLAPVEVRSKSDDVCTDCKTKECISGSDAGYGCPIHEYPGGMQNNSNCIICTECFKTCPHDNMTLNLRPPLADLSSGYKGKLDESILVLTLLALTLFHGFTMTPIWMNWAMHAMQMHFLKYMAIFTLIEIGFILLVMGVHYLTSRVVAVMAGARANNVKKIFIQYSYAFLPIALGYHLSHNTGHFNMEGLTIISVISDPFGWGWDLFGTANFGVPMIVSMGLMEKIEVALILAGFATSVYLTCKITKQLSLADDGNLLKVIAAPVLMALVITILCLAITMQPMAMRTMAM